MRKYIACLCAGILFVSNTFSRDNCTSALISKLVQDVLDNTNIIKPKVTDIQKTVNQLIIDDAELVAQLSQCCESLSSKLDVLNVSMSDVAILSSIDVVDAELSQCCEGVNSRLDVIDDDLSVHDQLIDSQLDVMESKIDTITSCGVTSLSSSDISGGTITLSTAGSYCLSEDVTADISITTTGVSLDLSERIVTGIVTVDVGEDCVIMNGFIEPPAPTAASDAGFDVSSSANKVIANNLTIKCADTTTDTVAGRNGIEISGNDVQVMNCTVTSGSGGDVDSLFVNAGDGGAGILIQSTSNNAVIKNCVIRTGNGGNSTCGTEGVGCDPGTGGHGIHVNNAVNVEIMECLIFSTGNEGSTVINTGGAGGDGIKIESSSVDISVHHCMIRNTGTSDVADPSGKAIDDDVAAGANESKIFANVAHNIANAIKFDLQASGVEKGFSVASPPDSVAISLYANVFM